MERSSAIFRWVPSLPRLHIPRFAEWTSGGLEQYGSLGRRVLWVHQLVGQGEVSNRGNQSKRIGPGIAHDRTTSAPAPSSRRAAPRVGGSQNSRPGRCQGVLVFTVPFCALSCSHLEGRFQGGDKKTGWLRHVQCMCTKKCICLSRVDVISRFIRPSLESAVATRAVVVVVHHLISAPSSRRAAPRVGGSQNSRPGRCQGVLVFTVPFCAHSYSHLGGEGLFALDSRLLICMHMYAN